MVAPRQGLRLPLSCGCRTPVFTPPSIHDLLQCYPPSREIQEFDTHRHPSENIAFRPNGRAAESPPKNESKLVLVTPCAVSAFRLRAYPAWSSPVHTRDNFRVAAPVT